MADLISSLVGGAELTILCQEVAKPMSYVGMVRLLT